MSACKLTKEDFIEKLSVYEASMDINDFYEAVSLHLLFKVRDEAFQKIENEHFLNTLLPPDAKMTVGFEFEGLGSVEVTLDSQLTSAKGVVH